MSSKSKPPSLKKATGKENLTEKNCPSSTAKSLAADTNVDTALNAPPAELLLPQTKHRIENFVLTGSLDNGEQSQEAHRRVNSKRTSADRSPISKDSVKKKYSNQKLVKKARTEKSSPDGSHCSRNSTDSRAKAVEHKETVHGTPPRGVTPYWKVCSL